MNRLTAVFTRQGKKIIPILFILLFVTIIQSCYHYRVINTNNDPGTEYRDTVMFSYAWGLVNKPKDFHVPDCPEGSALDEVVYSKNFGHSFVTIITLGIVSPIRVKWRCHKPCQPIVDSL